MDKKNISYNYTKAKARDKQNSQQDFTVEFVKENTFDEINLTHNESLKNKPEQSEHKDTEYGQENIIPRDNSRSKSRNKKDQRHSNRGDKKTKK